MRETIYDLGEQILVSPFVSARYATNRSVPRHAGFPSASLIEKEQATWSGFAIICLDKRFSGPSAF